eukprot:1207684-Pleurochrysis_carterae.AAC.1
MQSMMATSRKSRGRLRTQRRQLPVESKAPNLHTPPIAPCSRLKHLFTVDAEAPKQFGSLGAASRPTGHR